MLWDDDPFEADGYNSGYKVFPRAPTDRPCTYIEEDIRTDPRVDKPTRYQVITSSQQCAVAVVTPTDMLCACSEEAHVQRKILEQTNESVLKMLIR